MKDEKLKCGECGVELVRLTEYDYLECPDGCSEFEEGSSMNEFKQGDYVIVKENLEVHEALSVHGDSVYFHGFSIHMDLVEIVEDMIRSLHDRIKCLEVNLNYGLIIQEMQIELNELKNADS